MSRGRHRLTAEQLQNWQSMDAKLPGWGLRWVLVAEYARCQDDFTQEYLQLRFGPAFGLPDLWDFQSCAEKLGVAVSDLVKIDEALWTWVEPRLRAHPHWKELQDMDWPAVKERLEAS